MRIEQVVRGILIGTLFGLLVAGLGRPKPGVARAASTTSPAAGAPLFVQNVGQFPDPARYLVWGGPGATWLAEDGLWVTVLEQPDQETRRPGDQETVFLSPPHLVSPSPQRGVNLKLSFVGANPHPRLEPFGRLATHVSYFYGHDPSRWHADVPAWSGVRYVDLYPGVDLEVAGEGGRWSWRLDVKREDAKGEVLLRVEGADAVALDGDVLRLTTAVGDFTLPLLQITGVAPADLAPATIAGDQVISPFTSAGPHPGSSIPNPQSGEAVQSGGQLGLAYATYLGGSFYDAAYGVAVDSGGNAYVVGSTKSPDFPATPGAFGEFFNGGDYDAFVAKVNEAGTALVYATFLGSVRDDRGNDFGYGIAVDESGNAYLTGWTDSDSFPVTSGAYDTTFNDIPHLSTYDAFVAKLNAAGTALSYATYLGGSQSEKGAGVAVDGDGHAYVTGWTASSDFPAVAASSGFDTYNGGTTDVFVAKLNGTGSNLDYSMFVGGGSEDVGMAIAVKGSGYAYVTGVTQSSDFPWRLALDYSLDGPSDAFVAYVRPSGWSLFYSTYLGGSNGDVAYDIAVDPAGNAYITGETDSTDFPVTDGAFGQSYNGGNRDAFVVKLSGSGRMTYASYLGYGDEEKGYGIAADSAGNAYVTGSLGSDTVSKIDSAGTQLLFTLSGTDFTDGLNVAVDADGSAYVVGGKNYDAWVVKAAEPSYITGEVTDRESHPLTGIQIVAGGKYTVTTDADGLYSLVLPAGTYTITPATTGYFWSPISRTVSIPPAATNQDFAGTHVQKQVTPAGFTAVTYGDVLTYTVGVVYTTAGNRLLYDAVPTYTTYVSGSLSGPAGVAYDTGANAIGGTLTLTAGVPTTVTFAVQVAITGTAGLAPTIVNRACVRPEGSGMDSCDWSSEVRNYTHVWSVYLPLISRE